MREYENLIIFDPDITEEAIDKKLGVLKELISQGKQVKKFEVDKWGLKNLAYPLKKKAKGYYALLKFTAESDVLPELNRELKLSIEVMRYCIDVMEPLKPSSKSTSHSETKQVDVDKVADLPIEGK